MNETSKLSSQELLEHLDSQILSIVEFMGEKTATLPNDPAGIGIKTVLKILKTLMPEYPSQMLGTSDTDIDITLAAISFAINRVRLGHDFIGSVGSYYDAAITLARSQADKREQEQSI